MKKKLITLLVLSFVLTSGHLFAQIETPSEPTILQGDTLLVFPTWNDSKWDAINKWISYGGKLDSAGTPVNVYMLANNETYAVSHEIVTERPLSICAQQKPDAENAPPLVVAATDLNNEFPSNIIQNNGPVTVRNIYFCGADIEEPVLGAAAQASYIIQTTQDGSTNIVDGCYFEWMGGDGAAFSTGAIDVNITFTNNMVFNNGGNGGTAWYGNWSGYSVNMGNNNTGDIVMRNNTSLNCSGPFFINYGGVQKSVVIEHNTVINNAIYCFFNSAWTNAEFKSNIFYNCGVQGYDIQMLQVASDSLLNWGIVYVDTLSTAGVDTVYAAQQGVGITEVEPLRKISLVDNYYGWSSEIKDYWNSADSLKEQVWMNSRVQGMFDDDASYPLFTESGTFSEDEYGEPQFIGGYGGAATMDSLVSWLVNVVGGVGTSPTRYYYTPGEGDPQPNPAMVWPLGYNLAVGNSALVGTDGKPLGDLNWYPEYAERWDPGLVTTGVETINASIPDKYKLGQNYPNPFNPTTKIEFSLPQSGNVSLKVFNILGQEVATLVKEQMNAGTYKVDFDASNLTSGVYVYRLETANYSVSKKMLLVK
ncbi:MAG: T9SS type A sorting domain-containing protein [Ignavibacteria bacterium]|jgi:hypothetical protein